MFEYFKGVSKGTKMAQETCVATQETMNWFLLDLDRNGGLEMKTDDSLFVCRTYYFYTKIVTNPPTSMSTDKMQIFVGACAIQAEDILSEWLQNATGIYGLEDFFSTFDEGYGDFLSQISREHKTPEHLSANEKLNWLKSSSSELVISMIANYFNNQSTELKSMVSNCLSNIRFKLTK